MSKRTTARSVIALSPDCAHNSAADTERAPEFSLYLLGEFDDRDFETSIQEPSPIVMTALALSWVEPRASALDVLDRAMKAHERDDLDFAFDGDELELPHPFAELVRKAFAPHIRADDVIVATTECEEMAEHPKDDTARREWNLALLNFAERYEIWQPSAE